MSVPDVVQVTQHGVVPVLMYHSVSTRAAPGFRTFVLDPGVFREHLAALVEGGWGAATFSEHLQGSAERQVVLTFDDAFADFADTVLPALAEHDLRATLYVPTDHVGGTSRWLAREGEADRPLMSWSAVQEAASAGVEIGSHSRTHPPLDQVPAERLTAEVGGSRRELQDRTGQPVDSFCYPFGYHDRRVRAAVAGAGYRSACAVADLARPVVDRYALPRWTVRHDTTADELLQLLATRSTRRDVLVSRARSAASLVLRRSGLKQRGATATPDGGADS